MKIKALKEKAILLAHNNADENAVPKLLREEVSLHIELTNTLRDEFAKYFL